MGLYYDTVYKLDENGFSQILNASRKETNVHLGNEEYEIKREYFIDGEAVSEDEYHAAVNAAIDLSKTVKFFEKAVSYDVIKQQIEDCELS